MRNDLASKLNSAVAAARGKQHPHTQDDWIVSPGDAGLVVGAKTGRAIADCRCRPGPEQENKANAKLCAAAPDLLEALKRWAEYSPGIMSKGCPVGDLVAATRAAIARAEGGAA